VVHGRLATWFGLVGLSACGGSGTTAAASGSSGAGSGTSASATDGAQGDGATADSGEVACPARDDTGEPFGDALEHLGRAEGDSFIEILDMVADGSLVYSCTATQGLTIWDATDGAAASLVVENVGPEGLAHPSFPRCQHLGPDFGAGQVVVTNRGDEIQPDPWLYLYDISDPSAPQPLRGLQTTASIEGVVLDDGRIWAAAHKSGIVVVDDTGGSALVQVASFSDEASDAWAPFKVGTTLFVAEGTTGLRAYDISGDEPALLSTLGLPGSSKDVIVVDDIAYVAASAHVLAVDVSNPSQMTIVGQREVRGTALALDMGTDRTLLVAEWDEIRGYDADDPELREVLSETVPTEAANFTRVLTLDAEPSAGRVYAGEWRGMHAYDQHEVAMSPEVVATPGSLQFESTAVGEFEDLVLVIRNPGTEDLEIFGAASGLEGVTVDPPCVSVPPGGAAAMEVRFTPISDAPQRGKLILETNDPDEPEFSVSVSGNIVGLDVGDPNPPFELTALDGTQWSLDDLKGQVAVLAYFATF